ncbi:MAG: pantoate--beta-alanine ligase [Thiotrichales bacterium]
MRTIRNPEQLRLALRGERLNRRNIALVPTMGNLHQGHLDLVRRARQLSDCVVVSLFVNPLQFDREADLRAYPRTLENDTRMLLEAKVNYLFAPGQEDMYPAGQEQDVRVKVGGVASRLEGQFRLGHFDGVATVVTKLFNIVQPDIAVFGEKDYQQLQVVNLLVRDLNLPIKIVALKTTREPDGLAMSSRNGRLTRTQRLVAPRLYKILQFIEKAVRSGRFDLRKLEDQALSLLRKAGFRPEYVEICHAQTLRPAAQSDRRLVILAAAWLGEIRLIDNIPLELKSGD